MKRGGNSAGFTIMETMIVLAVSGVLFLSLVGMVTGQQGKAQFKNSMTNFTTELRSVIGQVSSGYYPAAEGNFVCEERGGSPYVRYPRSGETVSQGTNQACTFLGQAVVFMNTLVNDNKQYKIHTVVGLRQVPAGASDPLRRGKEPLNFQEAQPRAIAPDNTRAGRRWPDYSVTKTVNFGATVHSICVDDGAATCTKAAGFAVLTASDGQLGVTGTESGVVLPSVFPLVCDGIGCTGMGSPGGPGVTARNSATAVQRLSNGATAQGVKICFVSATSNQSALVRVGANASNDSVEMTIYATRDCT